MLVVENMSAKSEVRVEGLEMAALIEGNMPESWLSRYKRKNDPEGEETRPRVGTRTLALQTHKSKIA